MISRADRDRLAAVIDSVMTAVLDRSDGADGYPWIDTKIDVITGAPLGHSGGAVDLHGRDTVYAWIQGRGIEALAAHHGWFTRRGDRAKAQRCLALAERVAAALERTGARTQGRLSFWLDRDGAPFVLDPRGRPTTPALDSRDANFSDLFYARGLCALAGAPGCNRWRARAEHACRHVLAALEAGRFASDQQPFDARQAVAPVTGRHSHGPRMIAVGLCALAVRLGLPGALGDGLALLDRIAAGHLNRGGRRPELPPDTLCEFVDDDGRPWREDGEVLGDPGHAAELVGLALWLFAEAATARAIGVAEAARIGAHLEWLPPLLAAAFRRGWRGPGICKLWSLSSERVVNGDMPWWSLPETMRAAALLAAQHPARAAAADAGGILDRCVAGFLDHYVNPRAHGWAYQTLGPDGRPVRVIPATPDADPGYHTGNCLIQALDAAGNAEGF